MYIISAYVVPIIMLCTCSFHKIYVLVDILKFLKFLSLENFQLYGTKQKQVDALPLIPRFEKDSEKGV